MTEPSSPVALFDFDGTLTRRDTLLPFLRHCVGTAAFLCGLAGQASALFALATGRQSNEVVKQRVLRAYFEGWSAERLSRLGAEYAVERVPRLLRGRSMEILRWHLGQGHACYLVSASLDLYVEPWGLAQGFRQVLCSRLEVSSEGRVTGRLLGRNVYGPEKVARIREALDLGPGSVVYAYGDSRGDREMLALARYAWYRGRFQGPPPPGWMEG